MVGTSKRTSYRRSWRGCGNYGEWSKDSGQGSGQGGPDRRGDARQPLMIDHSLDVSLQRSYEVKRVDSDYFSEA